MIYCLKPLNEIKLMNDMMTKLNKKHVIHHFDTSFQFMISLHEI